MNLNDNIENVLKLKALLSIDGIGIQIILNLIRSFNDNIDKIFSADFNTLISINKISVKIAKKILSAKITDELKSETEDELCKLEKFGATLITILDNEYPPLLKRILCDRYFCI